MLGSASRRALKTMKPWRFLAPVYPDEPDDTVLRLQSVAQALWGELTTLSVTDVRRARGRRDEDRVMRNVVLHGNPASRIWQYACLRVPDLIVMPLRPARFRLRFWERSVLGHVLRRTDHPLMVVSPSTDPAALSRTRTVLCVVQLDGSDGPVVEHAVAVASRMDCEVALLHVVPELHEGTLLAGMERRAAPLTVPVAEQRMSRLAVPDRCVRREIRTGSISRNVAGVARQLGAGLIVVQRDVGRANCPDLRSVLRKTAVPVLSVPPADYDLLTLPDRVALNGRLRELL